MMPALGGQGPGQERPGSLSAIALPLRSLRQISCEMLRFGTRRPQRGV